MSDPPRLSQMHRGGLTEAMLDSARDDDPPASARQRALVAFGAGAGAILTAGMAEGGASVSAGIAGAAGSGASVATATKVATWLVVAKWAGGGAVLAVCTAAAVAHIEPRAPAARLESSPALTATPPPAPANAAQEARPSTFVQPSDPVVAPAAEVAQSPASRVSQGSSPHAVRVAPASTGTEAAIEPPERAPDVTLNEEVRWLDRASLAIRSGDVERGLEQLDEYKGRFPNGSLQPESQVLRIEALAKKGDRANATRLGEAFLARSPQSALAARVRSLLLSMQKEKVQ